MSEIKDQSIEIADGEDYVDRQLKKDLIDLRRTIREWDRDLWSRVRFGEIDEKQALLLLGDRVRDYIQSIEPVMRMRDDSGPALNGVDQVYNHEKLGIVDIPPPDEYRETERDLLNRGASGTTLVSQTTLQPKQVMVRGLRDVLEKEVVSARWQMQLRNTNPDPGEPPRKSVTVTNQQPLNRTVLQNAVRVADEWLQINGVGLKVDEKGLPTILNFDQSRDQGPDENDQADDSGKPPGEDGDGNRGSEHDGDTDMDMAFVEITDRPEL